VRELRLHKQFQAFCLYLLLFSQIWNKTWSLLTAAGSKDTHSLDVWLLQMNWQSYNFLSVIIGSQNVKQQRAAAVGFCTRLYLCITISPETLYESADFGSVQVCILHACSLAMLGDHHNYEASHSILIPVCL
jgi:hypothetical protein